MRFSETRRQLIQCDAKVEGATICLQMALEFPDESLLGVDETQRISGLAIGLPPRIPERFYEQLWYRQGLNAGVHRAAGERPFLPDLHQVVVTYEDLQLDADWDTVSADEIECLAGALEQLSHETARGLIDQVLRAIRQR